MKNAILTILTIIFYFNLVWSASVDTNANSDLSAIFNDFNISKASDFERAKSETKSILEKLKFAGTIPKDEISIQNFHLAVGSTGEKLGYLLEFPSEGSNSLFYILYEKQVGFWKKESKKHFGDLRNMGSWSGTKYYIEDGRVLTARVTSAGFMPFPHELSTGTWKSSDAISTSAGKNIESSPGPRMTKQQETLILFSNEIKKMLEGGILKNSDVVPENIHVAEQTDTGGKRALLEVRNDSGKSDFYIFLITKSFGRSKKRIERLENIGGWNGTSYALNDGRILTARVTSAGFMPFPHLLKIGYSAKYANTCLAFYK